MVMTKLNGEIIYISPLCVGTHDQSHWNSLPLQSSFLNKPYGILGDGGFTFNCQTETAPINGKKPIKKLPNQVLTPEEKKHNRYLSEMRVVIENSIWRIKVFWILVSVFHHWRGGRGQIKSDNIVHICVTLAN